MCFRNSQDKGDYAAPRPANKQQTQQQQQQTQKSTHASAAPPGPPPSQHQNQDADWDAPPPLDDVGNSSSKKHDWEAAVPDTALFPPPPSFFSGYDRSPANNATEQEAEEAEAWCRLYPLRAPLTIDDAGRAALRVNNFRAIEPPGFKGTLKWIKAGHWQASTPKQTPDSCFIAYPPLYVVEEHDTTRLGVAKTIYYEVKIHADSHTSNVALGFTALPYPSFRLPGWHRGSLAVHGDDGHKFINDRWGGRDFTSGFRKGETLGIGMTLKPANANRPDVAIFFTRDGKLTGSWDLHEETDAKTDLPVTGLEGFHDLSCAVGVFDKVALDIVFDPAEWKYKPV